ncbi:hypothetical protein LTR95_006903 [Oleoguttula sp. CCFEE 5521]
MNINTKTTSVTVTDSISLMSKVEWFTHKMESLYTSEGKAWNTPMDTTVVTELQKMKDLSAVCNHKPNRKRNTFGYERTPDDWCKIPTLIEEIAICLN